MSEGELEREREEDNYDDGQQRQGTEEESDDNQKRAPQHPGAGQRLEINTIEEESEIKLPEKAEPGRPEHRLQEAEPAKNTEKEPPALYCFPGNQQKSAAPAGDQGGRRRGAALPAAEYGEQADSGQEEGHPVED